MAIYKRGRGFELGPTEQQLQMVVRGGLDPATRPRCLQKDLEPVKKMKEKVHTTQRTLRKT